MARAGCIACPDCSRLCQASFTIIVLMKGQAKLTSFARCDWCVKRGDPRSLRASAQVETDVLQEAIDNGLLALRLG